MILLDTEFAKSIGFTSDKFTEWSYLYYHGDILWISLIATVKPRNGDFRAMMENIIKEGYTFRIPTPLGRMSKICIKQGWRLSHDKDCAFYTNEVLA